MRKTEIKRTKQKITEYFLIVTAVIVIWEAGASIISLTRRSPENVLPHLYQIIGFAFSGDMMVNDRTAIQLLEENAFNTLTRALAGFLIGTVIGYAAAVIMKYSGIIERILYPYIMLIQIIPVLGMAPLIYSITGDINKSRIIISVLLTFYPVAANTLAGFNSIDAQKLELMDMLSADRIQIFIKLLVPGSLPHFFTGLKVSAPMAVTASILVDTLQGDGGLGCLLVQSLKHAVSIYFFWMVILFCIITGILLFGGMRCLEKKLYKDPEFDR